MIDLKSILEQHPICLNSRASFKSILMDKYPSEKRMVNILTILFECGIANKIKAKKNIDANEMQRLVAQIENEYGISEQYSQEAILVWAEVFDITVSAVKPRTAESLHQEVVCPVEQELMVYVQGDVDDYDIVHETDGYYITHFNGFEEEDMTIPSLIGGKKIKGIARGVFKGCVSIKRIQISEGIEIIGSHAFEKCAALENVYLPKTLRQIKSYAFAETNLRSIILPQSVDIVGAHCFAYCSNLQRVELSDIITTINTYAFLHCRNLSKVVLPKHLEEIKRAAFLGCKQLTEVRIPIGTQVIEEDTFAETNLTAVYIPPTVVAIGPKDLGWTRAMIGDRTFGNNSFGGDLTIYCTAGSAAMEYARKNNLKCAKAQF